MKPDPEKKTAPAELALDDLDSVVGGVGSFDTEYAREGRPHKDINIGPYGVAPTDELQGTFKKRAPKGPEGAAFSPLDPIGIVKRRWPR